jgi:hypothetical protein
MPGPNDYHIVKIKNEDGSETVTTEPGLGADEPKERPKRVDPAILAALKETGEQQDRRDASLSAREQALAAREAELDRIRAELLADTKKAQTPAA